jgi:hypothetical protein
MANMNNIKDGIDIQKRTAIIQKSLFYIRKVLNSKTENIGSISSKIKKLIEEEIKK